MESPGLHLIIVPEWIEQRLGELPEVLSPGALRASQNPLLHFQEFHQPAVKHNYSKNYILYLRISKLYF